MKFCVLASGSKGNLTYIETNNTKILIDAGISYQEAKRRAQSKNIDFDEIQAIFITHEHYDHVAYLPTFLKRTQATLYINKKSLIKMNGQILEKLNGHKVRFLEADQSITINDIEITPLLLSHDSANCFGFHFVSPTHKLTYVVDTGFVPLKYFELLSKSDAFIIESNHDIEMLHESNRPIELKRRILSSSGHMSNRICSQIIKAVINSKNQYVVLAHLSEEVNTEEIALQTLFSMVALPKNTKILVAKQYEPLDLIILE
ncbi:MAG: MBL fold metallo-hydrolase [Acholeplasmataceae bacterium]|nr:MBL fold metallo-hydrolase [Acholeplasmataceae bacterium]